jgi:nucleotide-binding universal stress UspA family protein
MTIDSADPIVVGVDGSEQSTAAVRWAAREAHRRQAPLRVVHAWVWPLYRVPLGPAPGAPPGAGLRAAAESLLAAARSTARAVAGDLAVGTSLEVGTAVPVLLRAADGAALLVVGNRGLGGFSGLLLGSTGIAVSARARCPVVVVRGNEHGDGPVVVGIDGSANADAVLACAVQEAELRRTGLLLVHSFTISLEHHHLEARGYADAVAEGQQTGEAILDAVVHRLSCDAPDLAVTVRLTDRSAAHELVDASNTAQLVVVGSHGAGQVAGMLVGSTAHALIHNSSCPVLLSRTR